MRNFIFISLVLAAAAFAQPQFEIRLLPKPGPGQNRVVWVGENGDMLGTIAESATSARCYRYTGGEFTFFDTAGVPCFMHSANAAGQSAGVLRYPTKSGPVTAPTMAAFLANGTEVTALFPALESDLRSWESYSQAINIHGAVAGSSSVFGPGYYGSMAWIYLQGEYRFLRGVGGPGITPRAINDNGDVTGEADAGTGRRIAFLHKANGETIDMGNLGGTLATGRDINNVGQAVGLATLTSDLRSPGYMGFFYTGSVMMPVTIAGAVDTGLDSLNDRGEAVGSYSVPGTGGVNVPRALYYRDGEAHDLNTLLVDAPAGLRLAYGHFMQEDGSIIAISGDDNNNWAGTYLLIPVNALESGERRDARRRAVQ